MKNQFRFLKRFPYVFIFFVTLLSGISSQTKAQFVLVPDSNFRNALIAQGFGSCFTGNLIDSTCSTVKNCQSLYFNNNTITDLSGIESFSNLESLNCSSNSINFIPSFPTTLKHLIFSNNYLSTLYSLPTLPPYLESFDCSYSNLTSVPNFPSSLTDIDCSHNQISLLPSLPNNLYYLDCGFNNISNIPVFPFQLQDIFCGHNNLQIIPALPNFLNALDCSYNNLSSLPQMSPNLEYLYCNNNSLNIIDSLPSTMIQLYCGDNNISDIFNFPGSLTDIQCQNNLLSKLPQINGGLFILDCSGNPSLSCLPMLGSIVNLNFSNTNITCLPNYGNIQTSVPSLNTIPLCGFFNPSACGSNWNISGKIFFDGDSDCIFSNNDVNQRNLKIELFRNGFINQQTFSVTDGYYSFNTDSLTDYVVELDTVNIPFDVGCPTSLSYIDTLTIADSLKYNNDFSLKCKLGFDLAVTSIYANNFRPAHSVDVKIKGGDYSNLFGAHCASGISGTVEIILNGPVTFASSASAALTPSVNGDTLKYSITDFGSIDYGTAFNFSVSVDTSAIIATQICISVSVSPGTDNNPSNNFLSQCFKVRGSYDPNEKQVYPVTYLDIKGDRWLTYTINFQNTGTAPAEHIYITDTLDTNLDVSTFALLSYSHSPYVQILEGGIAKFNFPNINLPDSVSDEPHSHGFVQYKIKAKDSLAISSQISNTAYIYFDFNLPVQTNVVSNTVINCAQNIYNNAVAICLGEEYNFNGLILNQSGVYDHKYITATGCDSIVRITLSIQSVSPQISQVQDTLFSSVIGTTYQWLNCASNAIISGAVSQSYSPNASGNYAVIVTSGNCTDTSTCYFLSLTGIHDLNSNEISISPNPSTNEFVITSPQYLNAKNISIKVSDAYGKLIEQKIISSSTTILNASSWSKGIYFMQINCDANTIVRKLIKQ